MKKKNNIKVSYDKESEVLSMDFIRSKSSDSDINGNVVIDYDKNGRIVRLNIYGFSFDDFKENKEIIQDFARRVKTSVPAR
ncbi:MAG: DUF2283 domain-containing protein [bacterium]|nr:DUF2283 domain-containing protein [bacterium]